MSKKNLEIEALRGLAVGMVLTAHYLSITPWLPHATYNAFAQYFRFGDGVDLFFVISGFVVTQSLLSGNIDHHLTADGIKAFFVKRAFRILPTSLLWVGLTLLAAIFFNEFEQFGDLHNDLSEAAYIVGYTYNFYLAHMVYLNLTAQPPRQIIFGPYWSLSLEEQFYFLLPVVTLIASARRLWIWLASLVLIAWVLRLVYWQPFFVQVRFDGLLVGVLLCLAWRSRHDLLRDWQPTKLTGIPGAAVNIAFAILVVVAGAMGSNSGTKQIGVTLSALALVWLASYDNGHGLKSKVLAWIGARSYALYLTHLPMCRLNIEIWNHIARWQQAELTTMNEIPITISAIALVLLATEMNYRFVERPFIATGHRIAARMREESPGSPDEESLAQTT